MTKYMDIMDIKSQITSGRLAAKINSFGAVLLEDTQTCEAIKLMKLPKTFSHHDRGEWKPVFIYNSHYIGNPMTVEECWECSECGWTTTERFDWCTCGADMRGTWNRGSN